MNENISLYLFEITSETDYVHLYIAYRKVYWCMIDLMNLNKIRIYLKTNGRMLAADPVRPDPLLKVSGAAPGRRAVNL